MKLALHIGTEKTGTTLLQHWLHANRENLGRQGIFLSDRIGRKNNRRIVAYFTSQEDGYWRENGFLTPADRERHFRGFIEGFEEELRQAEAAHHTCIITSEHFHRCLTQAADLERFAEFCRRNFSEIRVLCYIREQSALRKSLYSTALRGDVTVPLDRYHINSAGSDPYYDYHGLARRWADLFGKDRLTLRRYDRDRFVEGDLRQDFLAALGVPVDPRLLDFGVSSANESLELFMAAAFMEVNRAARPARTEYISRANAFFKAVLSGIPALRRGELHDGLAGRIHEIFRDSNSRLSEEFFDGEEVFPPPVQKDRPVATLTEAEAAELVSGIVSALVAATADRILLDADADILRDIALKADSGTALDRKDAVALMEFARKARPDGPFIRHKLAEWTGIGPQAPAGAPQEGQGSARRPPPQDRAARHAAVAGREDPHGPSPGSRAGCDGSAS